MRRVLGGSLAVAIMALGAFASPVAAANNSTLTVVMGDCQFTGAHAGYKKTVKIEWRDEDGALKSKHSVTSNAAGNFVSKCERYEEIESGDTIKTTIGTSASPVLTIPPLSAVIDRDTDMITGRTTPSKQIGVELITFDGAFVVSNDYVSSSVSDTLGVYEFDASTADIQGNDLVFLYWDNPRGDLVVRTATAEAMTIWIGRAHMSVVGNPGTNVAVELKDGSDVIARSGGYLWEGNNGMYLYDDQGARVRVAAGTEVIADFSTSADLAVPNVTAVISKGTKQVTANCGLGTGIGVAVAVYGRDGSLAATRVGLTDGSGAFNANFATIPARAILAGDKVEVDCKLPSGDIVARRYTVS